MFLIHFLNSKYTKTNFDIHIHHNTIPNAQQSSKALKEETSIHLSQTGLVWVLKYLRHVQNKIFHLHGITVCLFSVVHGLEVGVSVREEWAKGDNQVITLVLINQKQQYLILFAVWMSKVLTIIVAKMRA